MSILQEDNRSLLISKGKKGDNYAPNNQLYGKNRYLRRVRSKVASSVKQYNSIDMNKLFKDNILDVNIEVQGETNNYIVTMSFGGFLDYLHDEIVKTDKLDLRTISRALVRSFNSDDVYIHCSCLHPSTKIKLLDGTTPTVEEMLKRYESGEHLYVYSVDSNGDFKPGVVEKVWITGTRSEFIKVTLDNNEDIITTPEHLYMLRDGSYQLAALLKVGQSLMPLYFNTYQNGYDGIKLNSTGKFHSVYKLVAEYFKFQEFLEALLRCKDTDNMKYDVAIHHIDFNKHNNIPENLLVMTAREHWDYHSKCSHKPISEEGRKHLSQLAVMRNLNPTLEMIEQRNKFILAGALLNYTSERRQLQSLLMSLVMNNYYNNLSEEDKEVLAKRRAESRRIAVLNGCLNTAKFHEAAKKRGIEMHTSEREELTRQGIKNYWKNISPQEKEKRSNISKVNLSKAHQKLRGVPFTEEHKKKISESRLKRTALLKHETFEKQLITKSKKVIDYLLSQGYIVNELNYLIYRKLFGGYAPLLSTLNQVFGSFTNYLERLNIVNEYNHKIKNIEYLLLEDTFVYDIKVKDYPNFLVDAGVILHNCPDWLYRMAYFATVNDINSGQSENRPSNITNPDDTKGPGCKHALLVLSNNTWLIKVSSVVNNYINYMKKHYERLYADVIYPAIYQKEYEEPVLLDFDQDTTELDTSKDIISKSNIYAKSKNLFTKGNEIGKETRFKSKNTPMKKLVSFDDLISD